MGWAESLLDTIMAWLATAVIDAVNALWELLAATAFVSPDVTALPQVQHLAGTCRQIVNTAYILAILWTALLVMARDTIQSQYGPGELILRLVIGLIAANLAMPLCSTVIGVANALTAALTSQDITAPGSMQHLRGIITAALGGPSSNTAPGLLLLVIGLVVTALSAILIGQWIIRLGVLLIAVGIAPLALALHATPHTEAAAKLWWRTFAGTLATVIVQAVALHLALSVFLDPDTNLPALGLPGGAVMNLMIVLCLLWGVVKIPGLMRRYVTRSSPGSTAAIARVLVIGQLTRRLRRGAAGVAGGERPGGGRTGSPGWPVTSPGGGGRSRPGITPSAPIASRPLPPPQGAGPGVVAVAYPTGRPVKPYTREELAAGVDLYTRSLKARNANPTSSEGTPR